MKVSITRHRAIARVSMVLIGMCAAACESSSTPAGAIGRKAGLWKGDVKIQNTYHTGTGADVQRLIEESTSTSCQPDHPFPRTEPDDDDRIIRRVIEVPKDGIVIIVEVPRREGALNGPASLIVRRQTTSERMTEQVVRVQPSPVKPEIGMDISVGTWSFTRLGDCPPGMKPFEKVIQTK